MGSPLANARDDASALPLSSPSAPTACLRAEPKSAPAGVPEPPPVDGSLGVRGDSPPMLIGIYRLLAGLGATQVNRPLGHLFDRVQYRHVGLIGTSGREHVGHLSCGVHVRVGDH